MAILDRIRMMRQNNQEVPDVIKRFVVDNWLKTSLEGGF